MKIGNLVEGFEVVDVKRVNKLNLIQFSKAVSEYIDQGYKIDVNSARQVGLVLQIDMYKLGEVKKEVTETKVEKQPDVKVEVVEDALGDVSGATLTTEEGIEVVEVPVKKTTSRTKKTT